MPVKAADLIARGRAEEARQPINKMGWPHSPVDRCTHGVAFHPPQPCRECDRVWHTEMLAKAEAQVAKHRAALERLAAADPR